MNPEFIQMAQKMMSEKPELLEQAMNMRRN